MPENNITDKTQKLVLELRHEIAKYVEGLQMGDTLYFQDGTELGSKFPARVESKDHKIFKAPIFNSWVFARIGSGVFADEGDLKKDTANVRLSYPEFVLSGGYSPKYAKLTDLIKVGTDVPEAVESYLNNAYAKIAIHKSEFNMRLDDPIGKFK